MNTVSNPHDRFFRQLLQNKEVAKDFLRYYLPEPIVQILDLESAEIQKDSFIEDNQRESFSDILYRVELAGKPGYIYFLFEHKSYPDRLTALQLLGYMVNIWKLHIRQNGRKPLPLIIPAVIYHGKQTWEPGNRFSGLMVEMDAEFHRYLPDFAFLLYDLPHLPDESIRGDIPLRIGLMLMKYIRDPEIVRRLVDMFSLLKGLMENEGLNEYVEMIFRYILYAVEKLSVDRLKTIVDGTLSEKMGGELMTIAEKLKKEGFDQGIEKGIKKGIEKGSVLTARLAVIDVLETRFGTVPDSIRQVIEMINDLDRLNRLHRAAVTVPDIDQFFALLA